jgi:hypothetical protein
MDFLQIDRLEVKIGHGIVAAVAVAVAVVVVVVVAVEPTLKCDPHNWYPKVKKPWCWYKEEREEKRREERG